MATVIGIFENQFKKNKPISVVRPGTQKRRFTHIDDTIDTCIKAWKRNKCSHYIISSKQEYSILKIAKMFSSKIKYVNQRLGERYNSSIIDFNLNNKLIKNGCNNNKIYYIINYIKFYDSFNKVA